MFFDNRLISIAPTDRVLEVGPGSTPHPRAQHFLELDFSNRTDRLRQRGGTGVEPNFQGRPVSYYSGTRFPFKDNEFDYVICSHVVEHVEDPAAFAAELFRVGKGRGYIEFPLPSYEYLYDFDVHRHFVWFDVESRTLCYLPKAATPINYFSAISESFKRSLEAGYDDMIAACPEFFVYGIEYDRPFNVSRAENLESLPRFLGGRPKSRGHWSLHGVGRRLQRADTLLKRWRHKVGPGKR